MARTGKKSVKRTIPRKRAAPKKGKNTKKARTYGPTSRDFRNALLLTAILVAASAVISTMALGIKRENVRRTDPLSVSDIAAREKSTPEMPEISPLQDSPPIEKTAELSTRTAPLPLPKATEENTQVKPKTLPEKAAPKKPEPQKVPSPATAAQKPESKPRTDSPRTTGMQAANTAAPPELPPKPMHQGTLVFIIDDAGNNLQELEPFLRFPGPLTIAVLPGLPHSAEAARRIRAAGKDVFLHQPMEAIGGQNPGPGAIYAGMDSIEVEAILRQNLAEIGPVKGMNNHQGSKITMNQQVMETVLAFCREQGICFLDSRTTAETAVPAAARNLGVKIGERNIFIDNEQNRPSMNRSIEAGLALASQKGNAVMIGHTWSPELAPLLAELYQNFITQGYTLVTASKLISR